MPEYTPSTIVVKSAYVVFTRNAFVASTGELNQEFDRWLAEVQAAAWDEGYGDDMTANTPRTNPYRKEDK